MVALHQLSLYEQSTLVHSAELSAPELTTHYLTRINELNPELGAFTHVSDELAIAQAEHFEQSRQAIERFGVVAGLPTADKDLDHRIGVPTSYGSRTSGNRPATTNDPITDAADAAGLISLGKTNAPEFGLTGNAINDLDQICGISTSTRVGPHPVPRWRWPVGWFRWRLPAMLVDQSGFPQRAPDVWG